MRWTIERESDRADELIPAADFHHLILLRPLSSHGLVNRWLQLTTNTTTTMSLVAYDASSSDDDDDQDQAPPVARTVVTRPQATTINKSLDRDSVPQASSSSSSSGPMRAIRSANGKIQILAPSFENLESSSDEDEERPKIKIRKPSDTGSGLRSLLPPVRGSSSSGSLFVPKSAKHPATQISLTSPVSSLSSSSVTSLVPQSVKRKPADVVVQAKKKKEEDDIDIDPSNFFSLSDDRADNNEEIETKSSLPEHRLPVVNLTPAVAPDPPVAYEVPLEPVQEQSQSAGMSEMQFKKLISNKFGDDPADNIDLVDINVNDHLSQNKEYLKSITTEKDMADKDAPQPNSTVRRKHHITYLAHQAKQRELALKEEWARNKATRNQSRAKYGF